MASTDRDALVALYKATDGANWRNRRNWNTDAPLGQWDGVKVNDQGRVVKLELDTNNLSAIPPELGNLAALQTLNLGWNQLSGHIPPELGKLGALKTLELSANKLDGHIPPELGKLGALKTLELSANKLDGTIPEALGKLTALQGLYLHRNKLSGNIPPELGDLRQVQKLWLNHNHLTGHIPPQLGQLGALKTLDLSMNKLDGNIPPELRDLRQLQWLWLSNNHLTGPIPPALGKLAALRELNLGENQLSGPIPKELGALSRLETLWLNDNNLTGNIPPELGDLRQLQTLYLNGNRLTGPIPKELGALSRLENLWLHRNNLTGLGETEDALRLVERLGDNLLLQNNPWIMPPEGVVEAGLTAVKRYLVDVQETKKAGADVTSLQLLKVVLVGSASAGKTSLMQSIIAGRGSPTKGTPAQASTVGMELRPHQLQDTKVEFFDCAGQVDYAGMHQTFLTRRALYLLVVDITKYHGVDDLDKAIHDDIMRWLYYLYRRAPGSTVVLVANKCDGSIDKFAETTEKVQRRVRELVAVWHEARGLRGRSKGHVTDLTLLPGMSRVSCQEEGSPEASGLPALIALISRQAATAIHVPPAWDLALEVIGALRASCNPIAAARDKLGLPNPLPADGVADVHAFAFISKDELSRKWRSVVDNLRGDVPAATISNWQSALEGALWISDFAGHTLRVDGGDGIFLDVLWLSKCLSPILSHKLKNQPFENRWLWMRDDLAGDGILRREFALHIWSESVGNVVMESEEVAEALFSVLIKLGVALPMGRRTLLAHSDRSTPTAPSDVSGSNDMLVIMRLSETCYGHQRTLFDGLASKMPRDRVEAGACWRYGAVFKSHDMKFVEGNVRLYTVALSMTSYNESERVFTARVFGPLDNKRVWVAIRYVASAMINLSKEWPGVLWTGWLDCEKHPLQHLYLASSVEARVGDPLLPAAAPDARRCDCLLEPGGVLRLAVENLGPVIDTGKGLSDEDTEDPVACNCVREAFGRWQPHAWRTAKWLFGLAVVLFTTAVVAGIVDDEDALWKSSLGVCCLLILLAVVASVFAYCGDREQGQSGGQHGTPEDVVAAFA
ncbi:LRR-GTPase of the ROCO family, putative pseudogene [Ectocarpus siliculosus]|nr:LRR-GTPase of the ROCO family, putative pseudogene [Ectocarpus siliculosus]|eukprot:CBN74748.1 LRR-GTPase of the ROCO family, putative pseudogene [Ectocarpus siliculosus]